MDHLLEKKFRIKDEERKKTVRLFRMGNSFILTFDPKNNENFDCEIRKVDSIYQLIHDNKFIKIYNIDEKGIVNFVLSDKFGSSCLMMKMGKNDWPHLQTQNGKFIGKLKDSNMFGVVDSPISIGVSLSRK